MQKLPQPVKPTYAVSSVDRALRLIQILRDRGEVRLRVVAGELGVSESTVHRLMAMLIYRGFAVQDESRVYRPGPAIGVGLAGVGRTDELRSVAAPHMARLTQQTGETCYLSMRVGSQMHVLWSEEGDAPLHVVARTGAVLPVISSAAGLMLLSGLPEEQVRAICDSVGPAGMPAAEVDDLLRRLRLHRRSGYAASIEGAERGVSAVAVAVHDVDGQTIAGLGIPVPTARFRTIDEPELVRLARLAQLAIEHDLITAEDLPQDRS